MPKQMRARRALVMPARWAASRQASQSTLGVIGLSARSPLTVPGNRYVLGFIHRQYSRKRLEQLSGSTAHRGPAAFALADMDHHAFAVDILDLEAAHLRPAHARRVERHQHGAMEQIAGGIDEPDRLLPGSG